MLNINGLLTIEEIRELLDAGKINHKFNSCEKEAFSDFLTEMEHFTHAPKPCKNPLRACYAMGLRGMETKDYFEGKWDANLKFKIENPSNTRLGMLVFANIKTLLRIKLDYCGVWNEELGYYTHPEEDGGELVTPGGIGPVSFTLIVATNSMHLKWN